MFGPIESLTRWECFHGECSIKDYQQSLGFLKLILLMTSSHIVTTLRDWNTSFGNASCLSMLETNSTEFSSLLQGSIHWQAVLYLNAVILWFPAFMLALGTDTLWKFWCKCLFEEIVSAAFAFQKLWSDEVSVQFNSKCSFLVQDAKKASISAYLDLIAVLFALR